MLSERLTFAKDSPLCVSQRAVSDGSCLPDRLMGPNGAADTQICASHIELSVHLIASSISKIANSGKDRAFCESQTGLSPALLTACEHKR